MKSPVKYLTDAQFTALHHGERALHIAAIECDVKRVTEHGTNAGPDVEKYLAYTGLPAGYAWCAAFVSWCLGQVGFITMRSASVNEWKRWAKRTNRLADIPKRGRLFFYVKDGRGHIGFVVKAVWGMIYTIEGNTNDDGSREGYKVCRRIRKASAYEYIRLD